MSVLIYIFDGAALSAAAAGMGTPVGQNTKRIITAAALVNTTAAAVPGSVNLVPAGGAPDATNCLISGRVLAPGETYFCPELIGQGLNSGGVVQALGAGLTFKYTAKDVING